MFGQVCLSICPVWPAGRLAAWAVSCPRPRSSVCPASAATGWPPDQARPSRAQTGHRVYLNTQMLAHPVEYSLINRQTYLNHPVHYNNSHHTIFFILYFWLNHPVDICWIILYTALKSPFNFGSVTFNKIFTKKSSFMQLLNSHLSKSLIILNNRQ